MFFCNEFISRTLISRGFILTAPFIKYNNINSNVIIVALFFEIRSKPSTAKYKNNKICMEMASTGVASIYTIEKKINILEFFFVNV